MRRNAAFALGLGAGLAVYALLRRRRNAAGTRGGVPGAAGEGGAAGLRRKLAESRGASGETGAGRAAAEAAAGPEAELERARAEVHRDAHATLDEMRRAGL